MNSFDWPALCRLGIGQLRLSPAQFWALTPAELQMLVGPAGFTPLGKSTLDQLMQRYPDAQPTAPVTDTGTDVKPDPMSDKEPGHA